MVRGIDSESVAGACHAIRIFDPERGLELGTFVYHQILAKHYRVIGKSGHMHSGTATPWSPTRTIAAPEELFAIDRDEEKLKERLTDLPEADRSLIVKLFWDGRTETEIASSLGISQQAVSKRKVRILTSLRKAFPTANGNHRASKPRRKL